jgi:hypothetical protein
MSVEFTPCDFCLLMGMVDGVKGGLEVVVMMIVFVFLLLVRYILSKVGLRVDFYTSA